LYLAFSCGQAAFPSTGDHIGVLGAATLLGLAAVIILLLASHGGVGELMRVTRSLVLVLAVPAAMAGLSLPALGALAYWRRRGPPSD
jgi:hypothetical protein